MERAAPRSPIWPCTRWGFPCPADHSAGGRLLPYLFTLTAGLAPGGGLSFCGTIRRDASRRHLPRVSRPEATRLRGIAPCGVRTFLPRSKPGAIPCPSKTGAKLRAAYADGKQRAEESSDFHFGSSGEGGEKSKTETITLRKNHPLPRNLEPKARSAGF